MSKPSLTGADTVLVVDDETFSRQIVVRFLRDLGSPNIVVAKNGAEAIGALVSPSASFRLIISDFNMPAKSGLELLKFIRTSTSFIPNDIPFLMLTGLADQAVVGAAMALDVDAFVVKPVSKAALESRICHSLADARTIKPPRDYANIDVTSAFSQLNKRDPACQTPNKSSKRQNSDSPVGRRVSLDSVQPGEILAEEIRAPTGELLLASGVPLTPRLISRLRDLVSLRIPIESVWVQR
jgi:CheY-like chemotaxis protein